VEFESSYGKVKVKVKRFEDECKKIAAEKNIPLRDVYRTVEAEARKLIK
jgi:uncharacterized protein (DUF111 family)